MKPEVLARHDERPQIAALPDGSLWGVSVLLASRQQRLMRRTSDDGGRTWSAPDPLLDLPAEPGRWGGCLVLVDRDAEVHAFLVNDRNTHVFRNPLDDDPPRPLPMAERRIDIWHTRTAGGRSEWQDLKRIWKGYTGSINGVIQLESGRIVLPFAFQTGRTWQDRGEGLDAFWYVGQSSTTAVYSDDDGATWHRSPSELKVQTPSIGLYGAIEPVIIQLKNGRVWMLIRTQLGRFYESFSEDGRAWSQPVPSRLISSDSPGGLARLPDGRIVLFWNKCLRYPYAHGGRHVLHAAVSDDEGVTWHGHREVFRDPMRHEPPPPGGDHGTAYPFPKALPDGRVLVTTGQGKGRVAVVSVDPDWLCERRQATDFSDGLDAWSVFGTRGVGLEAQPDGGDGRVLSIARTEAEWPATAVWNFPLMRSGRMDLRLRVSEGFGGAVLLTDHFSVPFDPEDELNAVFCLGLGSDRSANGGEKLEVDRGYDLRLEWDVERRECRWYLDERQAGVLPMRRETDGPCYLRLKATGSPGQGGIAVERVAVERARPEGDLEWPTGRTQTR